MIGNGEYVHRRDRLKKKVNELGLDAFLLTGTESIYYLTGATYKAQERPFFIVIRPQGDPTFLVPKLEEDHIRKADMGDVASYWEFPSTPGQGWLEKLTKVLGGVKRLGVEADVRLDILNRLDAYDHQPLDIVTRQRFIKTPGELEMIRETARYGDMMMERMLDSAYYGVSVLEMFGMGRKIQLEVIKSGRFDPLNCEFLSATWPSEYSHMPHGVPPLDGKLRQGPLAIMSYLRVNGYSAENERTVFLSPPRDKEREIFEHMRAARQKAFDIIKPGVSCAEVDRAALGYLREKGYGDYLLHRTGHGIGLGNHEGPWISDGSEHVLEENMVISVEPGIYIPGTGGFRHSDTVLITGDGYEILTKTPDDIESLTLLRKKPLKRFAGSFVQRALGIRNS